MMNVPPTESDSGTRMMSSSASSATGVPAATDVRWLAIAGVLGTLFACDLVAMVTFSTWSALRLEVPLTLAPYVLLSGLYVAVVVPFVVLGQYATFAPRQSDLLAGVIALHVLATALLLFAYVSDIVMGHPRGVAGGIVSLGSVMYVVILITGGAVFYLTLTGCFGVIGKRAPLTLVALALVVALRWLVGVIGSL